MSREYIERLYQSKRDKAAKGKATRGGKQTLKRMRPAKSYELKGNK